MKKELIFLLLILLYSLSIHSQTIHWIFFIDTTDYQLGNDNMNGKRALDKHFVSKVNAALGLKGYKNKSYCYMGTNCTSSKCNSVLNKLSCTSKDIVIFYYIGHGRNSNGGDQWPSMEFTNSRNRYLSLIKVHQTIKAKKPQLTFTIGMCCNKVRPQVSSQSGLSTQSKKYKIVNKDFAKKLQKLFLSNRGDIIITAASTGQEAQGGCQYETGEIDYFTGALCMIMDSYAASAKNDELTWSRFMKDITYWTHYYVNSEVKNDNGKAEEQRPYYIINVVPIK